MFNLKDAQGKIYLLQTIRQCSLYDMYRQGSHAIVCPCYTSSRHIAHYPESLLSTSLDDQFIIKEYNSGIAWWKKCIGQSMWEGAWSIPAL